jgi:hypothetical protein
MRMAFSRLMAAVLAMLGIAAWAEAQEVVKEALTSFSPQTIRLEYLSPAKLRSVPNYASLRQRYVGPSLRTMEQSFEKLGMKESDVDELVLGWRPGSTAMMEIEGFVAGRFTAKTIAAHAAAAGTAPSDVNGLSAYCLGREPAVTCLLVLKDSLGAFGSLDSLGTMLATRDGEAPSLNTDARFSKLVGEAQTEAPIWGVAVGEAVADWFRSSLPSQGNLQMDWGKAFNAVEAVIYNVDTTDKVRLSVKMDCADDQSAESTRQVFEGLKMFQQMAWQNMNPNRPNPYEGVEIARDGKRLSLKMTTDYADLEAAGALGAGQ